MINNNAKSPPALTRYNFNKKYFRAILWVHFGLSTYAGCGFRKKANAANLIHTISHFAYMDIKLYGETQDPNNELIKSTSTFFYDLYMVFGFEKW